MHRDRALGKDPIAEHKARKHRQRVELIDRGKNTFAAAARDYVEDYARANHRRWHETAGMLGLRPDDLEPLPGGLAQRWQDRPIDSIDGHDLWSVVDEAKRHAVPGRLARNKGISEPRGRALRAAASSWPRSTRRSDTSDPLGTLPAHGGLIGTETADPIGLAVLERESPGRARKSRRGLNRSNRLNNTEVRH